MVCISGKWAITPPEPKGSKLQNKGNKPKDSETEQEVKTEESTDNSEEVVMEKATESEQVAEMEQTSGNEQAAEIEQQTEFADQDFYDAVDAGAFIVTQNQTITINSSGKIVPPHEVAHSQAVHTGGVQSEEILENNSDLRITSPTKPSDSSAINKGKSTATIDITVSIE